jgi:hypothetical protein
VAFGGPETTPPRHFPPEGWVEVGSDDLCGDHAYEGEAYNAELDAWYAKRAAWERRNPRPLPPWKFLDENGGPH